MRNFDTKIKHIRDRDEAATVFHRIPHHPQKHLELGRAKPQPLIAATTDHRDTVPESWILT